MGVFFFLFLLWIICSQLIYWSSKWVLAAARQQESSECVGLSVWSNFLQKKIIAAQLAERSKCGCIGKLPATNVYNCVNVEQGIHRKSHLHSANLLYTDDTKKKIIIQTKEIPVYLLTIESRPFCFCRCCGYFALSSSVNILTTEHETVL